MSKESVNEIIKANSISSKIMTYWMDMAETSGLTKQEALTEVKGIGDKLNKYGKGTFQSRVAYAIKEELEREAFRSCLCPECYADAELNNQGFQCTECSYKEGIE